MFKTIFQAKELVIFKPFSCDRFENKSDNSDVIDDVPGAVQRMMSLWLLLVWVFSNQQPNLVTFLDQSERITEPQGNHSGPKPK